MQLILSILKSLSLGLWLGALIMLGYAVAGPIFQQLPSKTLAGTVNGIILSRMNRIEWVCAIIALRFFLRLLFLKWNDGSRTLRLTETAGDFRCDGYALDLCGSITDRMNTLRSTIGDFDHPQQTAQYIEAKSEFDSLHHRYTALVSANMILILSGFVLSMVNSRK